MDLSIIIPAYNEAERIEKTLFDLDREATKLGLEYELIVVDDGSRDGTRSVVESLQGDIPALRCVDYGCNRGKGFAVRFGMLEATGTVRLMTDADGSVPASEMSKLLEPLWSRQASIAIGSRYASGADVRNSQPAWRVAWSRLCNLVIQRSIVPGIEDTQCGFKAFSDRAAITLFSEATVDGWAFDLEILGLARGRFRVVERGVRWDDDERSKVSPLKDFIGVVKEWHTIRGRLAARRKSQVSLLSSPA